MKMKKWKMKKLKIVCENCKGNTYRKGHILALVLFGSIPLYSQFAWAGCIRYVSHKEKKDQGKS